MHVKPESLAHPSMGCDVWQMKIILSGWQHILSTAVCMAMSTDGDMSLYQSQDWQCRVWAGLRSVPVSAADSWCHVECIWASQAWLSSLGFRTWSWIGPGPDHERIQICSPPGRLRCCACWIVYHNATGFLCHHGRRVHRPYIWIRSNYWNPHKNTACQVLWKLYTAGDSLPFGAVSGGRLSDGSATYVAKLTQSNGEQIIVNYNSKSGLAFYEYYGIQTTTSMDI